jgi:RNA polymerase sigma-70 factor (ECF subfamily)
MSVLDAIEHEGVSNYQPYWAVRAHLLQRLGKPREPSDVYDRAIGFPEDPAVRVFLLSEARLLLLLNQKICDSVSEDRSLQQAGLKCGV